MWTTFLLIVYCSLIVLASLSGGFLPSWLKLTHTRLQMLMSLVAGLMLGVAVLHLLPHAVAENGSLDTSVGWMLTGLLVMFFLIRTFHVHQHGESAGAAMRPSVDEQTADDHDHAGSTFDPAISCHHEPHVATTVASAPIASSRARAKPHRVAWMGLAAGLSLHTLIDGIALSAAVAADVRHAPTMLLAGLGTFLAVLMHKPLDAMAITTVMRAGGWTPRARTLVNGGYALMCPIGAALFYFLASGYFAHVQHAIIGAALAFAAGVFLCIALADILPEVTFHSHDRLALSTALLVGVLLAYGIGFLEGEHAHSHHHHGGESHHLHGEDCAEHGH
jgi:zinc and cadmium transporter